MQRLLRHKLLIGAVAALLAASAGGAYAATQSGGNPQQALINDVANRLGVTPSQLRAAIQGALLDRLDAAVKAGRLTQAQANQIKQRIQQGGVPLPFAPFWHHRFGFGLAGGPPAPGMIHGGLGAAAGYLGLSRGQLLSDLRGGKTLAQVAHAQGKSVSGLEQAIVSAVTSRLDRLVSAGVITKHQEGLMVSRLSAFVDRLVTSGHVQIPMRGAASGSGWSPPPVQVPAPSGAGPFGPPPPGP